MDIKTQRVWLVAAALLSGSAAGGEAVGPQPVWKADEQAIGSPDPYTGKYCDYPAFDGLEFTFSNDPQLEQYGFQSFSISTNGIGSLPFSEYAGKKGKIGRSTSSRTREVLIEDCTVAYLRKDGEIQAEDARAFGVAFTTQPPTTWVTNEEVNRMTDQKSCTVIPQGVRMPFPMFFYHSREGFSVGVVGGDFPGRSTTFRVDKNRAIAEEDGLSGKNALALASQIRAGGKALLVSSYEWPHDVEQVREFNLAGLTDGLDHCKRSVLK
jgi:hypothetical protein